MRTKSDILKEYQDKYKDCMDYEIIDRGFFALHVQKLILEVLLDIREELDRPANNDTMGVKDGG